MIQVYTGDGKGKTTAGFGLVLRAIGAGMRAHVIQFGKAIPSSEGTLLNERGLCTVEAFWEEGFLMPGDDPTPFRDAVQRGIEHIHQILENPPDLLLIDEGCIALSMGLMTREQMEGIIDKAGKTELVITGRGAPDWLIERADLVTEMKKLKHYYDKGQGARQGIEF